jgi:vancomycin resistance protein VanW
VLVLSGIIEVCYIKINVKSQKVIKRSRLRVFCGSLFYKVVRILYWNFSNIDFASKANDTLEHEVFRHKSLLRRNLKDVDLWMQENKIKNLTIAIAKLDGILIKPGQRLSYWREIGEPTKRKGYVAGMVLKDGEVMAGIGGGLCQLSNLIYWATLHTELTVIERWRHSYDVFPDAQRTQPFGSGATCSYPNIDLQIENNTDKCFQLFLRIDGEFLVGGWLSDSEPQFEYSIFEKEHYIYGDWRGGYIRSNKIYRQIFKKEDGSLLGEEFITQNDAKMMYDPLIE